MQKYTTHGLKSKWKKKEFARLRPGDQTATSTASIFPRLAKYEQLTTG